MGPAIRASGFLQRRQKVLPQRGHGLRATHGVGREGCRAERSAIAVVVPIVAPKIPIYREKYAES